MVLVEQPKTSCYICSLFVILNFYIRTFLILLKRGAIRLLQGKRGAQRKRGKIVWQSEHPHLN